MNLNDIIDFAAVVPKSMQDPALIITVEQGFSFTGGSMLCASLAQETTTASGRKGKPRKLVTITVKEDEGMAGLIRALAHCFGIGEVEVGKSYTKADGAAL